MKRLCCVIPVLMVSGFLLCSCGGRPADNLGLVNSELAACPTSPNCVVSNSRDPGHKIAPLRVNPSITDLWPAVLKVVAQLPRTTIVTATGDYLHAECRSALFGFVDDLELHYRPAEGMIAVRSAARLGYFDFGVNRRRVETLRSALIHLGLVH